MARASALRISLNFQPSAPSLPRPSARYKHAHHLYALDLSRHMTMSARLAPSSRHLPSLFVPLLSLLVSPRPSPRRVITSALRLGHPSTLGIGGIGRHTVSGGALAHGDC